ncbi:MAG: UDP-N-acetylmuramate dehydrogenase [Spirochaetaceae bacterium]|nr:UDP-N-acetylmuramate dehydrogenase [Spirochaetaceae bacterium]
MDTLRKILEKINTEAGFRGDIRYDEPLAGHTTFRVGGPADVWIRPEGDVFPSYAAFLLDRARAAGIPVFILGGGANLVVSDRGIRGIVLDTGGWSGLEAAVLSGDEEGEAGPQVLIRGGTPVDKAAEALAAQGLGGLEFLAGMPGSIGGAVWMNARCYDRSVSDVLAGTEILDESLHRTWVPFKTEDFSYKKSPFQNREVLILRARFRLYPRPAADIRREMEEHRRDRDAKGHYRFPSAGSAFKNSRAFGRPLGQIIDELGLRGLSAGGASVAPFHGNIIINTGNASASDIRALTEEVATRLRSATGIDAEPEILFVGEWEEV